MPISITATLPNGDVRRFLDVLVFDAYVRAWRESGFSLSWQSPRNVTILKAPK